MVPRFLLDVSPGLTVRKCLIANPCLKPDPRLARANVGVRMAACRVQHVPDHGNDLPLHAEVLQAAARARVQGLRPGLSEMMHE